MVLKLDSLPTGLDAVDVGHSVGHFVVDARPAQFEVRPFGENEDVCRRGSVGAGRPEIETIGESGGRGRGTL